MNARGMMMAEPAVTQIAMMLVALHNPPHPTATSSVQTANYGSPDNSTI